MAPASPSRATNARPLLGSTELITDPATTPVGALGKSLASSRPKANRADGNRAQAGRGPSRRRSRSQRYRAVLRRGSHANVAGGAFPACRGHPRAWPAGPHSRPAPPRQTRPIPGCLWSSPAQGARGAGAARQGGGQEARATKNSSLRRDKRTTNDRTSRISKRPGSRTAFRKAGFRRDTIMTAMSVYKSDLSNMLSVVARIPEDIIDAIGPAASIGRRGWIDLAEQLASQEVADRVRTLAVISPHPGA